MDMTIAPSLDAMSLGRLHRAHGTTTDQIIKSVVAAAIAIDAGRTHAAREGLLTGLSALAQGRCDVSDEMAAEIASVRVTPKGHRAQTCAVRACLDIVAALHVNPSTTTIGERVGGLLMTLARIDASAVALDKAA